LVRWTWTNQVFQKAGTIYPPAGATALLAATEPAIIGLGWLYPGVVVLGTVIMLAAAMLVNNVMRRYPMYWWAPISASPKPEHRNGSDSTVNDEKGADEEASLEGKLTSNAGNGGAGEERLVVSARDGVVVPRGLQLSGEEWRILRILEGRIIEVYGEGEKEDHDKEDGRSRSVEARGSGDNGLNRVETFNSTSTLRV